jgi:hypothetical protein
MTGRQRELRRQLNERIPRGPRGSSQNELRLGVWFWQVQGHSFEDSFAKALAWIRKSDPTFEPRLLPAPSRPPSSSPPIAPSAEVG